MENPELNKNEQEQNPEIEEQMQELDEHAREVADELDELDVENMDEEDIATARDKFFMVIAALDIVIGAGWMIYNADSSFRPDDLHGIQRGLEILRSQFAIGAGSTLAGVATLLNKWPKIKSLFGAAKAEK